MTINDFRASARREWLATLLKTVEMQEVMEVLEQTGPAHTAVNHTITPHGAHIALGKREGYALYADMLRLLSQPIVQEPDIESNYQE